MKIRILEVTHVVKYGLFILVFCLGFMYVDSGVIYLYKIFKWLLLIQGGMFWFEIFMWIFSVMMLMPVVLSEKKWIQIIFSSYIFLTSFIALAFKLLGRNFGMAEANLLVNSEVNLMVESILSYSGQMAVHFTCSILLFLILIKSGRRWVGTFSGIWCPVFLVYIAVLTMIAVHYQERSGTPCTPFMKLYYPAPYKILFLSYEKLIKQNAHKKRLEPYFFPKNDTPKPKHLVFLVDESVRGDFFKQNGFPLKTTPHLDKFPKMLLNLGIASSAGNDSMVSNTILLTGLQDEKLKRGGVTTDLQPTLFDYAKQAGYATVHIDAQCRGLSNGIRMKDVVKLNDNIKIVVNNKNALVPTWEVDFEIINAVEEVIEKYSQSFIYINRQGLHYPYKNKYPNKYQDPIPKSMIENSVIERYAKATHYGVGLFLSKLFKKLEGKKVVLIYTSDHSDDLLLKEDYGIHGRHPHPSMLEFSVPMMLFSTDPRMVEQWTQESWSQNNYNKTSHFHVFPTLISFMGYPYEDIKKHYGKSLMDNIDDHRFVYSGYPMLNSGSFSRHAYDLNEVKEFLKKVSLRYGTQE